MSFKKVVLSLFLVFTFFITSYASLPIFTGYDFVMNAEDMFGKFSPIGNNSKELIGSSVRFYSQQPGNSRQFVYELGVPISMSDYKSLVFKLKNTGVAGSGMFRLCTDASNYYQHNYSVNASETAYRDFTFDLTAGTKVGNPTDLIKRIEFFISSANGGEAYVEYFRLISSIENWKILLSNELDKYKALVSEDYTEESWNVFASAKLVVESLLASSTTPSDDAINSAIAGITSSFNALVQIPPTAPDITRIPDHRYIDIKVKNFITEIQTEVDARNYFKDSFWQLTKHGSFTDSSSLNWSTEKGIHNGGTWSDYEGLLFTEPEKKHRLKSTFSVSPTGWAALAIRSKQSEAPFYVYGHESFNSDVRIIGRYDMVTEGISIHMGSNGNFTPALCFRTESSSAENIVIDLPNIPNNYFHSEHEIMIEDGENYISMYSDENLLFTIVFDDLTNKNGSVYLYENSELKSKKRFLGANVPKNGTAGFFQRNSNFYIKSIEIEEEADFFTSQITDSTGKFLQNITTTDEITVSLNIDSEIDSGLIKMLAIYEGNKLVSVKAMKNVANGSFNTYSAKTSINERNVLKYFVFKKNLAPLYLSNIYNGSAITLAEKISEAEDYVTSTDGLYPEYKKLKIESDILGIKLKIEQSFQTQMQIQELLNQLEIFMTEYKENAKQEYAFSIFKNTELSKIYKHQDTSVSIAETINDIISDCNKVTNQTMQTTTNFSTNENTIIPITVDSLEYTQLYNSGKLDAEYLKGKMDAFKIAPVDNSLVIIGSNNRGVMYGLYTISEEAFEIDPTYFWTDNVPKNKTEVVFNYSTQVQEPAFKYRGFFINDENYLLYWKSPVRDVPADVFKASVETMLRLRGNMFSVTSYAGTFPSLTVEGLQYMKEREVYITGSHMDILLSQCYLDYNSWCIANYGETRDFNYTTNKDVIQKYWRYTINYYKEYLAIWPIGLRDITDADYQDPDFNKLNIKEQTLFIENTIKDQVRILEEELGTSNFVTSYTARGKQGVYYRNGLFLPENCIMVWQDNGSTSIMEGVPSINEAHKTHGIYYHLSYCDNQWVQWVHPGIIKQEVVKSFDAGANEYVLYNVQDIREIPLSLYVGMKSVWDTEEWKFGDNIDVESAKRWIEFQFGKPNVDTIHSLYEDYYSLERDMRCTPVYELILGILKDSVKDNKPRSWFAEQTFTRAERFNVSPSKMIEKTPKWAALHARANDIYNNLQPDEGKQFFYDNMLLHIITSEEINTYGFNVYKAFGAIGSSNNSEAINYFDNALSSLKRIDSARVLAMHDKWENWFRGDDVGPWADHGWGFSSSRFEQRVSTLEDLYLN